jgi:predicted ATPase
MSYGDTENTHWQIGPFTLDAERRQLRSDTDSIDVENRVFDLLVMLANNRDRVVRKDELIETVWRGRIVSDAAIASCVKAARAAVGDNGRQQRFIKTVHGTGYRLVADEASAVASTSAQLPTAAAPVVLPVDRSELIGRTAEVENISALLGSSRLVTLLGIGGTGKTRLAITAARQAQALFQHGVFFVDLVPVHGRDTVIQSIAEVMDLSITGARPVEQLTGLLSDRSVLLVLDNCEHVVDAVAEVTDHLLANSTHLVVLLTSREPLDLVDEYRVNIGPLQVVSDSGTAPAVELLIASAARIGAVVHSEQQVQSLCAHLDGLPLSIELAAAQLAHLSLDELCGRLDRRFELLSREGRGGNHRQRSLQAVLADTWALLDADEQTLLCQLTVFPEPFTIDDVEDLVVDVFPQTASRLFRGLVNRSLATRESSRWRLLETVRLFAGEQCTDDQLRQLADRHAFWCLRRVGRSIATQVTNGVLADWCVMHHADLSVAEKHLIACGRTEDAANIIAGQAFAIHRDHGTRAAAKLRTIDTLLNGALSTDTAARLHVTAALCAMAARLPQQLQAHGCAAVTTALQTDDADLQSIAIVLKSWSVALEDIDEAIALVTRAIDIAAQADKASLSLARSYLGWHLAMRRDYDQALLTVDEVFQNDWETGSYPLHSAACLLAAIRSASDADSALEVVNYSDTRPDFAMWSSVLLHATVRASAGQFAHAAQLCCDLEARLTRAGIVVLPDLLIPAAMLAWRRGETATASAWLRAVREADRPTQSFIMAVCYRRLAEVAGLADRSPLQEQSLEAVAADVLNWLQQIIADH